MLIKAQAWIDETFREDSRPHIKTVKRWFENGEIEGHLLGSQLFIESKGETVSIGKLKNKLKYKIL